MGSLVAERERELDAKSGTVARLMADLKGEAQARYRADAALEAARRAHDAERDAHLAALRDKDAELARQLALLLDARADRARLEERLGGMQATIDNVRKELTGPAPAAPPAPAERDDLLYSFLSDGSVDSDVLDVSHYPLSLISSAVRYVLTGRLVYTGNEYTSLDILLPYTGTTMIYCRFLNTRFD